MTFYSKIQIIILFCFLFFQKNIFAQSKEYLEKYQKATELFNKGKEEEGLNHLSQAIALAPGEYEALYARAFHFFAKGDYQKAYEDYNVLLPKYQNQPEAVLGRANTALALEDYAQAEEDFLTLYEQDTTNIEAINGLGSAYFLSNMYDEALYFLNKSIFLNSKENEFAYFYRGSLFFEKKEYDKAMKDTEILLKKDAKDIDALRLKSKILFEQKKYAEMQKTLNAMFDNKSEMKEDDFVLWGRSFFNEKKYKEAEFYFTTPQKPQNPDVYYYKAKNHIKLNQLEQAKNALDSAIILQDKDNPISAFYFYDRSFVFFKEKNKEKAQYDYLKSVYLMPEFGEKKVNMDENDKMGEMYELLDMKTKQNLVDSCMIKGYQEKAEVAILENDDTEALQELEKAKKINPNNSYTYTLMANANILAEKWALAKENIALAEKTTITDKRFEHLTFLKAMLAKQEKNWTQAQSLFEFLTKNSPKNPDYWSELASVHYEQKNYPKALEYNSKAIEIQPKIMDYYNERALYLLHTQKYDEALANCELVIKQEQDNPLAYFHRGLIYKAQQRKADAKRDFEKVLSYLPDDEEVIKMLKSVE